MRQFLKVLSKRKTGVADPGYKRRLAVFKASTADPAPAPNPAQPARAEGEDAERHRRPGQMVGLPRVGEGELDDGGHAEQAERDIAREQAEHEQDRERDLAAGGAVGHQIRERIGILGPEEVQLQIGLEPYFRAERQVEPTVPSGQARFPERNGEREAQHQHGDRHRNRPKAAVVKRANTFVAAPAAELEEDMEGNSVSGVRM